MQSYLKLEVITSVNQNNLKQSKLNIKIEDCIIEAMT